MSQTRDKRLHVRIRISENQDRIRWGQRLIFTRTRFHKRPQQTYTSYEKPELKSCWNQWKYHTDSNYPAAKDHRLKWGRSNVTRGNCSQGSCVPCPRFRSCSGRACADTTVTRGLELFYSTASICANDLSQTGTEGFPKQQSRQWKWKGHSIL
jgi:hypothetical protein